MLDRGGEQRVGDAAVHLVERVGGLVEVVERRRAADDRYGGMPGRADEADADRVDGVARAAVTRSGPAGPSPTTTMRAAIRAQDDAGTLSVVVGVGPFGGSTVPVERFHRPYWGLTDTLAFVSSSSTASCSFSLRDLLLQEAGHLLERAGPPLLDLHDELAPLLANGPSTTPSSAWTTSSGITTAGSHCSSAVELGALDRADRVLEGLAGRPPDLDLRHHGLVGSVIAAPVALHLELVGVLGLELVEELPDGLLVGLLAGDRGRVGVAAGGELDLERAVVGRVALQARALALGHLGVAAAGAQRLLGEVALLVGDRDVPGRQHLTEQLVADPPAEQLGCRGGGVGVLDVACPACSPSRSPWPGPPRPRGPR